MENFFDNLIPLIAVTGIFVVIPILIFRFVVHRRELELSSKVTVSHGILERADRMETRIETLERLLDVEAPGWREKNHEQR